MLTYSVEELLATKLRALYQRKKGRDLYDFWFVVAQIQDLDIDAIIDIFERYMHKDNSKISRLDFENNLFNKKNDIVFNQDIQPLLSVDQMAQYNHERL